MKRLILFTIALMTSSILSFAQCNECNSLSEALVNPENVISIKHRGEVVDSLPVAIKELKKIKILWISGQNIKRIPKEIGELKTLTSLSFADNQLTSLPDEIFELKNLTEIIIWDNNFSEEYIEKLKKKFAKKLPNTKLLIEYEF